MRNFPKLPCYSTFISNRVQICVEFNAIMSEILASLVVLISIIDSLNHLAFIISCLDSESRSDAIMLHTISTYVGRMK